MLIGGIFFYPEAELGKRVSFRRGDLDHSFAGAKYLKEHLGHAEDMNIQKTISTIGRTILTHHTGRVEKRNPHLTYCGQAFKKAGKLFEVIDSDTKSVTTIVC